MLFRSQEQNGRRISVEVAQGGGGGNAKDRGGDRGRKNFSTRSDIGTRKSADYNSPKHSDKNKGRSGRKPKYS